MTAQGSARCSAVCASLKAGVLQPLAEVPLPQPVHRNAREEWIFLVDEPFGERLAASIAEFQIPGLEREARLHRLVLLRLRGLAARQDIARLLQSRLSSSTVQNSGKSAGAEIASEAFCRSVYCFNNSAGMNGFRPAAVTLKIT
jgi:hypothetical protein